MQALPSDLIAHALWYLDLQDLKRCKPVCLQWRRASRSNLCSAQWLAHHLNLLALWKLGAPLRGLLARLQRSPQDARLTDTDGRLTIHNVLWAEHEDGASQSDVVLALLAAAPDLAQALEGDRTPLHMAAKYGHHDCIQPLVHAKADVNATLNDGKSALSIACDHGNLECVVALIHAGASVNSADAEGKAPLYEASFMSKYWRGSYRNCYIETDAIVEALLCSRANVNHCAHDGATALLCACQTGAKQYARLLLAAGANVNVCMDGNVSPLAMASQNGHVDCVRQCLAAGARVNEACDDGQSPLYVACFGNWPEVVLILLEASADADQQRDNGRTPLHVCIQRGVSAFDPCVQLLLGPKSHRWRAALVERMCEQMRRGLPGVI